MSTARATRSEWAERVQAWRTSGESAEEFALGQGYSPGTLKWWSHRIRPALPEKTKAPRFLRVVPRAQVEPQPEPAPARVREVASGELVVEVGHARVRVGCGFDAALLQRVVAALGGAL
jgi:hypothetical protein